MAWDDAAYLNQRLVVAHTHDGGPACGSGAMATVVPLGAGAVMIKATVVAHLASIVDEDDIRYEVSIFKRCRTVEGHTREI